MIYHLFNKSDNLVYASLSLEALRELGDLRINCGLQTGYQIIPLDYLICEAYII